MLVWNESAHVVDPEDFQLYTWADWSRLKPREGEQFVKAVRFRLRVPEVVALTGYDRLPLGAVTFSRRNVFKRDHYTCQYCGAQPGSEELTSTTCCRGRKVACRVGRTASWRAWPATSGRLTGRRSRPGWRAQAACPANMEAAVRRPHHADRKLVEVRQRSLLER